MAALPDKMIAIVIRAPGGPEMLIPEERPLPRPGDGEILIRVHAAGVNRPDIMQRRGQYPPPPGAPADIPGLEVAGTVADLDAFLDRHFSEPCWQYRLHVRVPLSCDADQLLMVLDAVSQPKAA